MKTNSHHQFAAALAGLLLAALTASATDGDTLFVAPPNAPANKSAPHEHPDQMFFRYVDSANGKPGPKEATWLGVGAQETSEPLAAQLDLKTGEGLVVNFVATNSPAAAAGLRKNDVLVELDGQMLVDPTQLQKLVQMHADGDSVKIQFYRSGKKQSATAKVTKHTFEETSFNWSVPPNPFGKMQYQYKDLVSHLDQEKINLQVQEAMQQAQQAVQQALKETLNGTDGLNHKLEIIHKKLGTLADGGMNLDKDATVVVKNDGDAVRTMVKKDASGTYVIVADPAKHLTVHDTEGKLLFDGTIESPAEQKKVPGEIWEKVEPMLGQMDHDSAEPSDSKSRNESK